MTEPERDERIAQAYRALGREEPRAALDAAILAASRRHRARWRVPLAAAAALTLAVGVALVVEREERTRTEEVVLAPQVMKSPAPVAGPRGDARSATVPAAPGKPQVAPERAAAAPPALAEAKRERSDEAGRRVMQAAEPVGQASAPAADRSAPATSVAGALSAAKPAEEADTPERWLERIAGLREQGRVREADESLAEFRRRHPDYRIPEPMLRRVAPR
ncbi:MAG: hypothetical protein OEW94_03745 [Betaproteobacteria bacterium]|nr:hypothetical protein [Betaproteobacteria bacterium]MDH5349770.1 hypothetical protein [Betaproteobacteria bacterium]